MYHGLPADSGHFRAICHLLNGFFGPLKLRKEGFRGQEYFRYPSDDIFFFAVAKAPTRGSYELTT